MERNAGDMNDANQMIELADYFSHSIEFAKSMLIEGASSEPMPDGALVKQTEDFLQGAHSASFQWTISMEDGRTIALKCQIEVTE